MTGRTSRTPGERPKYLAQSPPVPAPDPISAAPEGGGRGGLDPVRYGDWEIRGIAIDF